MTTGLPSRDDGRVRGRSVGRPARARRDRESGARVGTAGPRAVLARVSAALHVANADVEGAADVLAAGAGSRCRLRRHRRLAAAGAPRAAGCLADAPRRAGPGDLAAGAGVRRARAGGPAGPAAGHRRPLAGQWLWAPAYVAVPTLLLQLLPDGHPLPGRWRAGLVLGAVTTCAVAVSWALTPYDQVDEPFDVAGTTNPVGVDAAAGLPLTLLVLLLVLASFAVSVASLVARWRVARAQVVERQRLKWVLVGAGLTVALLVAAFAVPAALAPYLVGLGMLPLPAACLLAVARYGLWEVDLVINRSLVYGALTAAVVGTLRRRRRAARRPGRARDRRTAGGYRRGRGARPAAAPEAAASSSTGWCTATSGTRTRPWPGWGSSSRRPGTRRRSPTRCCPRWWPRRRGCSDRRWRWCCGTARSLPPAARAWTRRPRPSSSRTPGRRWASCGSGVALVGSPGPTAGCWPACRGRRRWPCTASCWAATSSTPGSCW